MINDKYYNRRYWITAFVVLIFVFYIGRLFYWQVIDKSTAHLAESNALVKQTLYPSRGLIYDRNGELLVYNQPIYEVTMIMRDVDKNFDTLGFCQSLGINRHQFITRINEMKNVGKNRGYSKYTPQVFLSQLSKSDVVYLQESVYKYKGVEIRNRSLRDYKYSSAAHLLGSVGEVSKGDLEKDDYYSVGDYCGKDGIESVYETRLRGEKGMRVLMRNSRGVIEGSYNDGKSDYQPAKGEDLQISIDIQTQMVAEQLLQGKIGSIVAIEPQTGEILAMASNPSWNPSVLVGKERSAHYQELLKDPTNPLFNRATQAQYPPGSTFKTVQALIALQEGTLKTSTYYPCSGKMSVPITCTHDHGSPVEVKAAIEQSCNPFFWAVYRDMLEKNGYGTDNVIFKEQYNHWRDMVVRFGFANRFAQSDITGQKSGNIPTIDFYDRYYGKKGWKAITIRSLSIGQGELLATPLQLCNMAAIIANDGYYIAPHLLKCDSLKTNKNYVPIDKKHFEVVKQGMVQVMERAAGSIYHVPNVRMAGKTGTAQAGAGKKDHSIFIGIAPVENPQIAVAVVVENSGFGATWALPMATLVIEQYINKEIKRKELFDYLSNTVLNADVKKW